MFDVRLLQSEVQYTSILLIKFSHFRSTFWITGRSCNCCLAGAFVHELITLSLRPRTIRPAFRPGKWAVLRISVRDQYRTDYCVHSQSFHFSTSTKLLVAVAYQKYKKLRMYAETKIKNTEDERLASFF